MVGVERGKMVVLPSTDTVAEDYSLSLSLFHQVSSNTVYCTAPFNNDLYLTRYLMQILRGTLFNYYDTVILLEATL